MTDTGLLAIGEVAAATGAAVSAVRYYDEIGVIRATTRVGGKRRFDREAVGRVNFIRLVQEAGFSLAEIRTMLDDEGGAGREGLIENKLVELSRRRDHLEAMIAMVGEIRDCGCEAVASCPRVDDSVSAGSGGQRTEFIR